MKHLIGFRDFLMEKAIPFSDILLKERQQGIIMTEGRVNNSTNMRIAIYDFDDKKILAYISVRKWDGDSSWHIDMSVAEKNYGPDIYDLALMSVYPETVMPSRTIRKEAQNIWKFYAEKRPDVIKEDIKPSDPNYAQAYTEEAIGKVFSDPDILKILNKTYQLKPTPEFKELVDRGNEYAGEYGVNFNIILNKAKNHFWKIYNKE